MKNKPKYDLSCVIRTSGENTTGNCRSYLKKETTLDNIAILGNKPFHLTLKESLEQSLMLPGKWALIVDADVVPFSGSVVELLKVAENTTEDICELQGIVFDRLFGGWRPAGVHLYRKQHIPLALEKLNTVTNSFRPETSMLNEMEQEGVKWKQVLLPFGLHDFWQFPKDIFRKAYLHANKHLDLSSLLIKYWKKRRENIDFHIALKGLSKGILHQGDVPLDKNATCYSFELENNKANPIMKDPLLVYEKEVRKIIQLKYTAPPVWDMAWEYWQEEKRRFVLEQSLLLLNKLGLKKVTLSQKDIHIFFPLQSLARKFDIYISCQHLQSCQPDAPLISICESGKLSILEKGETVELSISQPNTDFKTDLKDLSAPVFSFDFLSSTQKDILIYAAGNIGKALYVSSTSHNINVLAFLESSSTTYNSNCFDKPILSPEVGLERFPDADIVIASRAFVNQILHRLLSLKINKNQKIWVV